MLSNASIALTHWLQPPAFGFESLMRTRHPVPTDVPRHGTHYQHVLDIAGAVPRDFSNYHLRVDVHVRGALWRTQTHPLCTSLHPNPEMEMRRCASGNGTFSAQVWSFIPSSHGSGTTFRPSFATPPRPKLVAEAGQHNSAGHASAHTTGAGHGSAHTSTGARPMAINDARSTKRAINEALNEQAAAEFKAYPNEQAPRDLPGAAAAAAAPLASRPAASQLRQAVHVLSRINVCSLSSTAAVPGKGYEPLPDRLVGTACNTSIAKALNM